MSDHREVQRYPCSECERRFTSPGGLTKHLLQKHFAQFSQPHQTRIHHPHLNGTNSPATSPPQTHAHFGLIGQPCDRDGRFIATDSTPQPPSPAPPNDWSPFASKAHFRLAEFTYKKTEMSKANTDELIEIWEDFTEDCGGERPFRNAQDILNTIDAIDLGHVPWETFSLEYPGEPSETNPPSWMTKEYRVWFRDPRQVIHTILANHDFDGEIDYSPHQVFVGGKRKYSDFMSGDWAWKQAVGA